MQYVGRGAAGFHMAFQHVSGQKVYHGPHCMWCRLWHREGNLPPVQSALPYLHPEPRFLTQSGQSGDSNRNWLLIDTGNDSSVYAYVQQCQRGYRAKYNMNYEVELSQHATPLTDESLERALSWVTRHNTRGVYIMCLGGMALQPRHLQPYMSNWTKDQVCWLIYDSIQHEPQICGLKYEYGFTAAGQSYLSRRPTTKFSSPGTLLVLRMTGRVTRSTLWQQSLHQVIVDQPGHRSLHELLTELQRLLSPHQVSPVLESNHQLNMDECFFGFEASEVDE